MYFIDLTKEEIAANFAEIFRFNPFFSQSSNTWTQRRLGTCFDFYVLDQMSLQEDPAATQLSESENVTSHWFNDVTETRTKHLFEALGQGLISESTYKEHACEEVYYLCEKDDPSWRYEFTCPHCERPVTIFLPMAEPASRGGSIPDCPFCGNYSIQIQSPYPFSTASANNEATLKQETTGGGNIYPEYVIYPQLEGESAADRKARLVALALDDCKDTPLPADDQARLLEQLYDRNPNILHVAKTFLEEVAKAGDLAQAAEIVQAITMRDNANSLLRQLGVNTRWSAPTPSLDTTVAMSPDAFFGMGMGMGMGFVPTPTTQQEQPPAAENTGARPFCTNCGALAPGKFCPECGTPTT